MTSKKNTDRYAFPGKCIDRYSSPPGKFLKDNAPLRIFPHPRGIFSIYPSTDIYIKED
jgi:hypothetical protein